MNDIERMKELIKTLSEASRAYYAEDNEIMSNYEYDKLYDELVALEEKTGTVLSGSLTQNVGYEAVDELPKEAHESPMLSLDKTKDREALRDWLNGKEALLSWKLDGLTIVLTYNEGKLVKAVTRGNGVIGEVITNNAKTFVNIPLSIPYKGELILRGEAVISYSDFDKINEGIEAAEDKYKNPRNLCSGSVRQLNSEITAKRSVRFYAFSLVKADEADFHNSRAGQMEFLKGQGFEVVEYHLVDKDTILDRIQYYADAIKDNPIPSDGLVLTLEDIEYGRSLGRTAKFPRDSIAFKWQDEIKETKLLEIEWSPSRTGLINPVAVFEPVELEGTTVKRASVHNISIMRALELGIGDRVTVYKANMIIPQIEENLTRSGLLDIPNVCPACGDEARIKKAADVEALYCMNPDCVAKRIKSFSLFVSRDAMNMDGLSEMTMEKFIAMGFIHELSDIYHLSEHRDAIVNLEGFGEKSYVNMIDSIDKSRKTSLERFLYALGIPGFGVANAKMLCKQYDYDLDRLMALTRDELSAIDKIGPVLADSFVSFFENQVNRDRVSSILGQIELVKPEANTAEQKLNGLTFVITGSVEHFANRNEVKYLIEKLGGKVTGSVTSKTNYLINNDISSNSGKNKKAKELNIPIISEEDFIKMIE